MDLEDISDLTSPLTTPPNSPPSSPLSSLLESPEVPFGWRDFTPPPSQDASDDMQPARKRRRVEPKTRTTRYLDLTSETAQSEYDRREALDVMLKAVRKRRKIVVVAGAGISVSAGIPDFRSSHGLFRSLRGEHKLKSSGKELFDASVYKDDSSTSNFHDMVRKLSTMAEDAKPTPFHRFLARLSTEGRLLRLYTQNVDGLETSMPPLSTQIPLNHKAPWPQTIQLHGGLEKMMCQKCRHISDFQAQLFQGPTPPLCPECTAHDAMRTNYAGKRSHGIGRLRPRIVLYNEHNPDDEAIGAVTTSDMRTRPDAVIVVGTSLKIPAVRRIVREMCSIVRDRKSGVTMWINHDAVPPGKDLEDCWDLIVNGDSDEVARLAGLREWDDNTPNVSEEYTESDVEKVKLVQGEIKLVVPSTPKKPTTLESFKKGQMRQTMTPPLSQDGETQMQPSPLKLPKPIKGSPLKQKLTSPAKPKPKASLKNPASGGRSISDVLGKENKVKSAGRPKGSLNKKTGSKAGTASGPPPPKAVFGKVSKRGAASVSVTKRKAAPEPLSPRKDSNASAAMFPNLGQYSSTEASPVPESPLQMSMLVTTPVQLHSQSSTGGAGDGDWRKQETISPTGSIPRDMIKLLN